LRTFENTYQIGSDNDWAPKKKDLTDAINYFRKIKLRTELLTALDTTLKSVDFLVNKCIERNTYVKLSLTSTLAVENYFSCIRSQNLNPTIVEFHRIANTSFLIYMIEHQKDKEFSIPKKKIWKVFLLIIIFY
jgi:hypothetical protein